MAYGKKRSVGPMIAVIVFIGFALFLDGLLFWAMAPEVFR
jgi:hypothetical protein